LACTRLVQVPGMVLLKQAATNSAKKCVGLWGFVPLNLCRNLASTHEVLLAVLREKEQHAQSGS